MPVGLNTSTAAQCILNERFAKNVLLCGWSLRRRDIRTSKRRYILQFKRIVKFTFLDKYVNPTKNILILGFTTNDVISHISEAY